MELCEGDGKWTESPLYFLDEGVEAAILLEPNWYETFGADTMLFQGVKSSDIRVWPIYKKYA